MNNDKIEWDIDSVNNSLSELHENLELFIYDIKHSLPLDSNNTIFDLDLFKEKLELFGLKDDKLWEFIDYYMKFYNNRGE